MKVVHVFKSYYPDTRGGVEEVIRQTCLQLKKKGVENILVTVSPNVKKIEIQNREECQLIRFPEFFNLSSCPVSIQLLMWFKKIVKDADLIHYYFPWPFADLVHFLARVKTPYFVMYQSDVIRQKVLVHFYKPLMHWFLRNAMLIVATSKSYLNSSALLERYKYKCKIVSPGLDQLTYPTLNKKVYQQWQSKLSRQYFLFVGRLRYYKGLEYLLHAVQGTSHQVVIAGSGEMEKHLKAKAKSLKIESQVNFLGEVNDYDKVVLLSQCHGYVFPSCLRSEAFGISLLEAAMFAKPMITSEINTGTSVINKHGVTGFVTEPRNSAEIQKALNELAQKPGKAKKMGLNARKRFLKLYTADIMVNKLTGLYKEYLGFKTVN